MTIFEKKRQIRDYRPKDRVQDVFFVKYIQVAQSRDGRSYLNIILGDKSGDIEGRIWNDAQKIASSVNKSDVVRIDGKINVYQGKLQLVISEIERVDCSEAEKAKLVKASKYSAQEMLMKLKSIVKNLDEVYIRDLLNNILEDREIEERLQIWPAAKNIHHAYQSGLLEHILSCTELALVLAPRYEANMSYVVAGCILHDLCKIYELSGCFNTEYTEEGKLIGHLSMSTELIDRFSFKIKGFPKNVKSHLKHILLSHHGEYEYGSPKIPQTKEAFLVHLIDYLDSKMAGIDSFINSDSTPGVWTSYNSQLNRIFYKKQLPSFKDYYNPVRKKEETDLKQNLKDQLKDFKI